MYFAAQFCIVVIFRHIQKCAINNGRLPFRYFDRDQGYGRPEGTFILLLQVTTTPVKQQVIIDIIIAGKLRDVNAR